MKTIALFCFDLDISFLSSVFKENNMLILFCNAIDEIKNFKNQQNTTFFYISSQQDVSIIDDEISMIKELIPHSKIIACIPKFGDKNILQEYNIHRITTPVDWNANSIFDRIYGEIIMEYPDEELSFYGMYGYTRDIIAIRRQIGRYAKIKDPILITGETGTGKEIVANALYKSSLSKEKYLPINCGSLQREIIASELFGHEKGAFTGAITNREGLFTSVGKGIIFLDEIGELPLDIQTHLLRIIEQRNIRPLGSNNFKPFNGKIIFATNRNLEEECAKGNFRKDLYERLKTFHIFLPPLRQHKADITILAQHFLTKYNKEQQTKHTISNSFFDTLFRYHWPGNIRELHNLIRYAAVQTDSAEDSLHPIHVYGKLSSCPSPQQGNNIIIPFQPEKETWAETQNYFKKQYFVKLLQMTGGDKSKAASLAGISRQQLYNIIKD